MAQDLTLSEEEVPTSGINAAHIFVTDRKALGKEKLEALRKLIDPAGFIWVSWPKKSAGVETDITSRTQSAKSSCPRQRSGRCQGLRGR